MSNYGTINSKADRDSLFEGQNNRRPARVWGEKEVPQETDQTRGLENDQLLTYQKNTMETQDRIIDVLGESVARTKQIAYDIGKETDVHIKLIDDLDERVEKTSNRVKNTTRRVEKLEMQSSTKCMWFCIIFLIIGLVAVGICAVYF